MYKAVIVLKCYFILFKFTAFPVCILQCNYTAAISLKFPSTVHLCILEIIPWVCIFCILFPLLVLQSCSPVISIEEGRSKMSKHSTKIVHYLLILILGYLSYAIDAQQGRSLTVVNFLICCLIINYSIQCSILKS